MTFFQIDSYMLLTVFFRDAFLTPVSGFEKPAFFPKNSQGVVCLKLFSQHRVVAYLP